MFLIILIFVFIFGHLTSVAKGKYSHSMNTKTNSLYETLEKFNKQMTRNCDLNGFLKSDNNDTIEFNTKKKATVFNISDNSQWITQCQVLQSKAVEHIFASQLFPYNILEYFLQDADLCGVEHYWKIIAPENTVLNLTFTYFRLRHCSDKCLCDNLTLFDMSYNRLEIRGTFCGVREPWYVISKFNMIKINLKIFNATESFINTSDLSAYDDTPLFRKRYYDEITGFAILYTIKKSKHLKYISPVVQHTSLFGQLELTKPHMIIHDTDVYHWHIRVEQDRFINVYWHNKECSGNNTLSFHDGPTEKHPIIKDQTKRSVRSVGFHMYVILKIPLTNKPCYSLYYNSAKLTPSKQCEITTVIANQLSQSSVRIWQCALEKIYLYLIGPNHDDCAYQGVAMWHASNNTKLGPFCAIDQHKHFLHYDDPAYKIRLPSIIVTVVAYVYDYVDQITVETSYIDMSMSRVDEHAYFCTFISNWNYINFSYMEYTLKKGNNNTLITIDPKHVWCIIFYFEPRKKSVNENITVEVSGVQIRDQFVMNSKSLQVATGCEININILEDLEKYNVVFRYNIECSYTPVGFRLHLDNINVCENKPSLRRPFFVESLVYGDKQCGQIDNSKDDMIYIQALEFEIYYLFKITCKSSLPCVGENMSWEYEYGLDFTFQVVKYNIKMLPVILKIHGWLGVRIQFKLSPEYLLTFERKYYTRNIIEYPPLKIFNPWYWLQESIEPLKFLRQIVYEDNMYSICWQGTVMNWKDANDFCYSQGSQLLYINSEEEFYFVRRFLALAEGGLRVLENMKTMSYFLNINGLRWQNGDPIIYSDWHKPDPSVEYDPSPTDILNLTAIHDQQVTTDHGTLMVVHIGNPLTRSHWFKVPSLQKFRNVGIVCKRPSSYTCGPRHYNISEEADYVMPHVNYKDGLNVLVPGTLNCPSGWNYVLGKCFRLLTTTRNITEPWNCDEALQKCFEYNGQAAKIKGINLDTVIYYLKIWLHEEKYGGVWLHECSALVPNTFKRELQEEQFVLVKNISQDMILLNVLCETESVLSRHKCGVGQFECFDGSCILEHHKCDQIKDCINGEDEANCTCSKHMFKCRDHTCIPASKYCDHTNDCYDGSDEVNCSHIFSDNTVLTLVSKKHFIVKNIYGRRGKGFVNNTILTNYEPYCSAETEVRCHIDYSYCIPRHQVCIYDDLFDHHGCLDRSHLHNCENYLCPDMFKCPAGYCIPYHKLCDGIKDCAGGIDEENCTNFVCPGLFRCRIEGICLDQRLRCDGHIDCPISHEDELLCEKFICPVNCTCWQRSVDCSNHKITQVVMIPKDTRTYNVSFNNLILSYLPYVPYLYILDLQNTSLRSLPDLLFQNMSNLKILDLSWNFIVQITENTFLGLDRLDELILHHNLIEYIKDGSFQFQTYLNYIDLCFNKIEYIEENTFSQMNIGKMVTDEFRFCCLAQNAEHCIPEQDEFSSCKDLISGVVFKTVIWILGILATVGNIFVIFWRSKHSQHYSRSILFINLAVSDLLMGIYLIIIAAADWFYTGRYAPNSPQWRQSPLCKLAGFLSLISSEVSVSMLVIISANKWYPVLYPFRLNLFTGKLNLKLCVLCWILFGSLGLLPFLETSYFGHDFVKHGTCLLFNLSYGLYQGWEYMTFLFLLYNALSFFFIFVAHISMYSNLYKSRHAANRRCSMQERWLVRKFSLIVATDAICWLPLIITSVFSLCGYKVEPRMNVWLSLFVLPVNSALNPYLYSYSTIKQHREEQAETQV